MLNKGRTTSRLLKLTKEENEKLIKDAYAHEMNVSEYLRWLVCQERKRVEKKKCALAKKSNN